MQPQRQSCESGGSFRNSSSPSLISSLFLLQKISFTGGRTEGEGEINLNVLLCLSPAGSIIRCMRRLEEVLRQMCSAAKAIGNTELENKFAEGENIQNLLHLSMCEEETNTWVPQLGC